MSKYKEALAAVLEGECFKDCLLPGQEVTPATIADDIAAFSKQMQAQMEKLSRLYAYPELLAEELDELATNAGIMRSLAEARVTLVMAAAEDGLCFVPVPSGAALH